MEDILLTQTQAAEILNISPRTLEGWRRKGLGPSFVVYSSRCVRYSERALLEWVQKRKASLSTSCPAAESNK